MITVTKMLKKSHWIEPEEINGNQDGNRNIVTFLCVNRAPLTYSANDATQER